MREKRDDVSVSMEEPYGELVETTCSVLTWNVWGRFGPWELREQRILEVLAECGPDIVVLQESWVGDNGDTQARRLAENLGYLSWFSGESSLSFGGWGPASAVISKWPIHSPAQEALEVSDGLRGWPGEVITCVVDGPRGQIPLANVALDWPPQSSALRQAAVRDLAKRCKALDRSHEFPVIVCGDFNAGPESAELRSLTGAQESAVAGFVLFDAWDKAGDGPGTTWDRANQWAAPALLPSRRIDFVLTGWPTQNGGGGDVIAVEVVGRSHGAVEAPSDHYGVMARLRY